MGSGFLLQCSNCGTRNRVPQDKTDQSGKCGKCGTPLVRSHSLPIHVTDATWDEEILRSATPVIVEMWSPHCGVCTQYELSVRKMAVNLYGRARVAQMNVEENPRTAQRYSVRGVPTVLLFQDGRLLEVLLGPQGESGLREKLGI